MNVKQIVLRYLEDNGYDGLYDTKVTCGCDLDDIMPCEDFCGNCKPGHKVLNTENDNVFGWNIVPVESATDSASSTTSVIERASKK